jgi:glycine oxidase
VASVGVVGGGVIGLSVAWRAALRGYDVVLCDPEPTRAASWVAGGMLAPVTEAWPGEEELLDLGAASLERWPSFAADLGDAGLSTAGTLVAAVDQTDRAELDRLAAYLAERGRDVEALTGRELRALEPGLGPAVRAGLHVPGDFSVDNRQLLAALHAAASDAGVRHATAVSNADVVVIAAGAWSGRLHPALEPLIRPVKGEILRLEARTGALPPPSRTIRGHVQGRQVYLVPRPNGLVVGATQYESGFDLHPKAGGVRDLLNDAEQLLPGLTEYALTEVSAGLRPGSPDNLPLVGWLEPGVIAATGHYRNGILLAPITADTVVALIDREPIPDEAKAADPGRFTHKDHLP